MSFRSPIPRRLALVAALAAVFSLPLAHAGDAPASRPWMDRALGADQRARLALGAMTRDEKLRWVFAWFGSDFAPKHTVRIPAALPQSAGYVPGTPRLGLPALFETDAGLGVASQAGPQVRERTQLPSGLATAASITLKPDARASAPIMAPPA